MGVCDNDVRDLKNQDDYLSSSLPRRSTVGHFFSRALLCANHQAFARRFDHIRADLLQRVDLEDPADLRQQSVQEAKVPAGDAQDRGQRLLVG